MGDAGGLFSEVVGTRLILAGNTREGGGQRLTLEERFICWPSSGAPTNITARKSHEAFHAGSPGKEVAGYAAYSVRIRPRQADHQKVRCPGRGCQANIPPNSDSHPVTPQTVTGTHANFLLCPRDRSWVGDRLPSGELLSSLPAACPQCDMRAASNRPHRSIADPWGDP